MMKLLAVLFCAVLFASVLTEEASARRGGGLSVGGGGLRGFSGGAYRGGLRTRTFDGYRAAAWGGPRYWRGGKRWYGYGAGIGALAGAYYYNAPYYDYSYSSYPSYSYPAYGYSSYGYSGGTGTYAYSSVASAEEDAVGPGTCGTYRYWKDGRRVDARGK
jgi:hypothetical protein